MPRLNPFWVPLVIVRHGQTLRCRVALDSQEVARAIRGSAGDRDALCIQSRKAFHNAYKPTFVGAVPANWPGYVDWNEIEPDIQKALQAADIQAREEFLSDEYWRKFQPVAETFDHC